MSERWEQSISDWYEKSRTANLEYLDLSSTQSKVTTSDLANNLAVIFDRISLFSRISIKNHKVLLEKFTALEAENRKLKQEVANLSKLVIENQPITKSQVLEITEQISKQPKAIEEQAVKLSLDLKLKLEKVEALIEKISSWTNS
ncbi:hypothetical protein [Fatsia badnavirus 1]|uniref:Uncharacterized protein n=1 Tax=Fatsia badnavirus 1 TaxID=2999080 RepID=A0A9E8Z3D9_9VIRU|nr:hypothetical protein [Fatsia badnavirus 1]